MLDSVIIANKKYYLQTFLEECKYKIKKNKVKNLINDFDLSSSDNEPDNKFDIDKSVDESIGKSVDESINKSSD